MCIFKDRGKVSIGTGNKFIAFEYYVSFQFSLRVALKDSPSPNSYFIIYP